MAQNIADALLCLKAERDENTCRKSFTPGEAVAVGSRLEELEKPKTLPTVKAFDHIWATYKDSEGADGILQTPNEVYVDRIYDAGDFSAIGVG